MNIVVLDGYTLNPGDLSWEKLQALGNCTVYDRTPTRDLVERARNAEIVLTNKVAISAGHLAQLPALKYIGILATGTNVVDLAAARSRNVTVTNVPAYGTKSVAQMAMALLLELTQHVGTHSEAVRNGRWSSCPDWCFWDSHLVELDGLTFGLIGAGRIGLATANLAHAFGMNVLAYNPTKKPAPDYIRWMPLERVFRDSDVVSLHCPLTSETKGLVNRERLSWMKPSAFLLNTSRGPLIDEQALADALNCGGIAGAALDVLSVEPPPLTNPLLSAKNCIITPHMAWGTKAARIRLMNAAVDNIAALLSGNPKNIVN